MSAPNPSHKQRQLALAQERGLMLRVALLVLLIASVPQAKAEPPDEQALHLLNRHRQLAGLPPVKLDQTLSAGCMEHAVYMVQNQGTDAMAGLNPHTQRPNLAGASAAGAACAKAADLFPGVSDLGVAIEAWMAGMYHRRPMLDPQLERIGVGYARLPDGMLMAALRFESATLRRGGRPVAYPADNQTDVPLEYGTELPNPIPDHGAAGGYPITLQFPPFDKVTGVSAKLTEATGKPVEFFLSDPEHPATSFGQFGVVCLIPKQSLQAQHAYTVRIDATWKGKPGSWAWSFSTVSLREIEASDDHAVAAAINIASLVHGTVAHGGMRNSETVFLQLAAGEGSHYKMLSVIIPIAVWRQIAGAAEPESFRGKIIEVQTTPQVAGGKYVNMRISAATQLRLVSAQ
jgi:Cysteine-rich secretory protein family